MKFRHLAIAALVISGGFGTAVAQDKKTSAMTAASTLTGTEYTAASQGSGCATGTTPCASVKMSTEQQRVYTMSNATSVATIKDTACAGIVAGTNVTKTADTTAHTCTLAASGGGGGSSIPVHPGYLSQKWYRPGPYGTTNANSNDGVACAYPVMIREDVTVDALGVFVNTVSTGTAKITMGIYANNTTTKRPGALLFQAPEQDTSSTTFPGTRRGVLGTPQTLTAGIYWAFVAYSGVAQYSVTAPAENTLSNFYGVDDKTSGSDTYNTISTSNPVLCGNVTYSATLPSNFSTVAAVVLPSNSNAAIVGFRKQ